MSDVFIGNMDYYLPKLSITKVEVLNGTDGIDLVVNYKFIYNKTKTAVSRPRYADYIKKHIKPYIAAIPGPRMADIYEKHLRDPKPVRPFLENMPYSLMLFSGLTEAEVQLSNGMDNIDIARRYAAYVDNYNFFLNTNNYRLLTKHGKKMSALAFADNIEKSNVNEEDAAPLEFKFERAVDPKTSVDIKRTQSIFAETYNNNSGLKTIISKDYINQTKLSLKVQNETSSGYTQIYLFAFAFLDIDSLLNDDSIIESGIKGSSGLDGLKEQLLSDANLDSLKEKRKYFHGKITRELILHGDFNFNKWAGWP